MRSKRMGVLPNCPRARRNLSATLHWRMAVSFDGCRKSDFEHDGRGCRSEGELDFELAALHVVAQFQARHDQL